MSQKLTYEYVEHSICNLGYNLISKEYKNNQTKMLIECKNGHTFEMSFNGLSLGRQCPECREKLDVKAYLETFGYALLSEYSNMRSKIQVQCTYGHSPYWVTLDSFKSGHRCPFCATESRTKQRTLTIDDVRQRLLDYGFYLLSEDYVGRNSKLLLKCKCGHTFRSSYSYISTSKQCQHCKKVAERQAKIKIVKDFVSNVYGYKVLNPEVYETNTTALLFECEQGHLFQMGFNNFKSGQRCAICSRKRAGREKAHSYDYVKAVVQSGCYELVSEQYINSQSKLTMRCHNGHVFQKSYTKFKQGQRCPICQLSKGEETIRKYLESKSIKFTREHSFPDCRNIEPLRFDFAIYDKHQKLILLIEYDGEYHYFPVEGQRKLKRQQKLDSIKNTYCSTNSIPLLRIPYTQFDNIEAILSSELSKHNLLSLASN